MRLSRADFRSACKSFFKTRICISGHHGLWRAGVDPALFWADQASVVRVQSVFARYDLGGDYRAIDMILVIIGIDFGRWPKARSSELSL